MSLKGAEVKDLPSVTETDQSEQSTALTFKGFTKLQTCRSDRNRLCSTRVSEGRCGEQVEPVEPVEPVRGGMLGEAGSVLGDIPA